MPNVCPLPPPRYLKDLIKTLSNSTVTFCCWKKVIKIEGEDEYGHSIIHRQIC